ncbi:sodium:solute symporter [Klebsiella sp. Ap-873]|nr:sodium:solute symporter [Klebsiella sp. Ap-873]
MKKISELALFTLFFSNLSGLGLTAGFFCFIGVAQLLGRVLA